MSIERRGGRVGLSDSEYDDEAGEVLLDDDAIVEIVVCRKGVGCFDGLYMSL